MHNAPMDETPRMIIAGIDPAWAVSDDVWLDRDMCRHGVEENRSDHGNECRISEQWWQ